MNSVNRPNGDGKGPLQPHISNLPRRRPKRTPNNAPPPVRRKAVRAPSSSSTENASRANKTLHSSNRTTCPSDSPLPQQPSRNSSPSPSPARSSSSSRSSSASSSEEANDNVLTGDTTPSRSIPHSLGLPKPKGHLQPHVHHMPRRRRTHLKLSPEEQHAKWREEWDMRKHKQEVVKGSGIWIAFDIGTSAFVAVSKGKEKVLSSEEEEDEADAEKRQEFARYAHETEERERRMFKYILRVETRPPLDAVDATCSSIGEDGNTHRFYIPTDSLRDDGVAGLSNEQLTSAAKTIQEFWSSEDTTGENSDRKNLLIVTPRNRPVEAISLAILVYHLHAQHSCSSAPSPVANILPRRPSTPPALRFDIGVSSSAPSSAPENTHEIVTSSSPVPETTLSTSWLESSSVHSAVPSSSVDPPAIVSVDPMTPEGAAQSPALAVLTRMHDLEDLKEAWRGALSYEGVACIDEVLRRSI
ncbi:hypothetical protein VNI00_010419 [Paramarasmius palmivorus]|uniref:Uncharacterized protein n=1 Tax=Paramarasmius palmivorus TaxID=297713 RepID=A0AAW0CIT2_9AGAR